MRASTKKKRKKRKRKCKTPDAEKFIRIQTYTKETICKEIKHYLVW